MATDITQALSARTYPGRGIIVGKSVHKGKPCSVVVYFIMGRSENSRNRVFVKTDDGLRTEAKDPAKMTDPSLIIYPPVRTVGDRAKGAIVVTNGDQTDTIADALKTGGTFEKAVYTRTFEPDPPHFTPRISAVSENSGYKLSVIKAGSPYSKHTNFFAFDNPQPGFGHYIHTYMGEQDGRLLPFEGEPLEVVLQLHGDVAAAARELADTAWNALDIHNRISLYVRISDTDGAFEDVVINK